MLKRIIWIKSIPARFFNYNTVALLKSIVDKVFEIAGGILVIALLLADKDPTVALFTVLVTVFLLARVVIYLFAYGYTTKEVKELIVKMATSIVIAVFGEGWYSYIVMHDKENLTYAIAATILLFLDIFVKKEKPKS